MEILIQVMSRQPPSNGSIWRSADGGLYNQAHASTTIAMKDQKHSFSAWVKHKWHPFMYVHFCGLIVENVWILSITAKSIENVTRPGCSSE